MRSPTLALPLMLVLPAMGCGPSAEDPAPIANESNAVADESVDARAECEQLLEAAIMFAKELLADRGEFLPYGSTLSSTGEIGPRSESIPATCSITPTRPTSWTSVRSAP